MKVLKIMIEKTRFKVEVSAININSSKKTIITTIDYHLTHDKIRKKMISSILVLYFEYDRSFFNRLYYSGKV